MTSYLVASKTDTSLNHRLDVLHEQTKFTNFVDTFYHSLSEDEKHKYWDNSVYLKPYIRISLSYNERISINGSAYMLVHFDEDTRPAYSKLYEMRIKSSTKQAMIKLTPYVKDWSIILYRAYEDLDIDIIKYIMYHQLPCNLSYVHLLHAFIPNHEGIDTPYTFNRLHALHSQYINGAEYDALASFIYRCRHLFTLASAKIKFLPGCAIRRLPRELLNFIGDFF